MSNWVRIGAKCICIKGFKGRNGWPPIVEGQQYTVREIVIHPETGEMGVRLEGIICGLCEFHIEKAWEATRFRPVISQSEDIALFHALCPGLPVVPPAVVPPRVRVTTSSD